MTDTDIAARFRSDTANHQMTVLHDDGLYRHLRFNAPDTGFYWFDLVTWPGRLAFTGDIDGFMFARVDDMFEFFRGGSRYGINPHYWSEKVVDGRDRLETYCVDVFTQRVNEEVAEYAEEFPGLAQAVEEKIFRWGDITHGEGARAALDAFAFLPKGVTDRSEGFRFVDTWEWTLTDWDWQFLWACHAIVWGIAQYDKARQAVPA